MSFLDSYKERQLNEFQVLESIFEDDLQDLRKTAWKTPGPLHIKLSLKPQQSMGGCDQVYVGLDMVIKCPPTYPDVVPVIELMNVKGVSYLLVKELKENLDKQAKEKIGEVMIWELANIVQVFLYKNNRPPEQSFHEQMMKKKKEELEEKEKQQRLIKEQERKKIEEEVLRHQAALRSEKQKRKDEQKNVDWSTPLTSSVLVIPRQPSFSPTPSPIVAGSPSHLRNVEDNETPTGIFTAPLSRRKRKTSTRQVDDDEQTPSPGKDPNSRVSVLQFIYNKMERRIHRGNLLGHSRSGSAVYAGMDAVSGELVAVTEWVLKWRHAGKKGGGLDKGEDTEGTTYLKQVTAIEQEVLSLVKLRHVNLIHYLAMKHQYDPGKITVNVLTEYSGGSTLSIYVEQKEKIPLEVLRSYTTELLDALSYLHKNSIVHKDLRPSSVFVDSCKRIRLADYSIGKRLGDLYAAVDKNRPAVHFSDSKPPVIGRGQKGDIYQLGLMLLTLIMGQRLSDSIPKVPNTVPSALHDFLNKCLLVDERLRATAAQLKDHSFIKEPVEHSLKVPECSHNKADMNGSSKESDGEEKEDENFEYLLSLVASGQSRLTSEFELIKVLGKGGFGDVLKVKNKLDGRFYAKKNSIEPEIQNVQ